MKNKLLKKLFSIKNISLSIFILILFFIFSGLVFAAPTTRQDVTITPITDSTYNLGSVTKAWLQVIADSFYDTNASDGCAEWSSNILTSTGSACGSGGGSGGLATTTPFVTGDLVQVTDSGTVNSIATSSLGLPLFSDLHDSITLSGALDYLTLVGQDIVRGLINLTTDITGLLPSANIVDEYLFNNADDVTTGSLTATEFIANDANAVSTFAGDLTVTGETTLNATTTITGASNTALDLSGDTYDLFVGSNNINSSVIKYNGNRLSGVLAGSIGDIDYTGVSFEKIIIIPDSETAYVWLDPDNEVRFALAEAGVDKGTYNPRSMIIAGPWVENVNYIKCSFWGFWALPCNTGANGADLGVQNNLQVTGSSYFAETLTASSTSITNSIITNSTSTNSTTTNQNITSLTASMPVFTDSIKNLVSKLVDLTSDVTGLLPSANIVDEYLLNTGDTATGDYNFDSGTLFIDSSNNRVGVGTASPGVKLEVTDSADVIVGIIESTFNGKADETLRIAASSNSGSLEVLKGLGLYSNNGAYTVARLDFAHGGAFIDPSLSIMVSDTSKVLQNRIHIKSNGNVGIGTASPTVPLQVGAGTSNSQTNVAAEFWATSLVNNSLANVNIYSTDAFAIDKGGSIGFGGANAVLNPYIYGKISGRSENGTDFAGYLSFLTANSASTISEAMRIDSSGNVGIGTASPGNKLEISFNDTEVGNGAGVSILQNGTGDSILQYRIFGATRWFTGIDNSDGDKFKIASSADLDSNARLTIDISGNVGIGTASPLSELTVIGDISVGNDINVPSLSVDGFNPDSAFWNGTGNGQGIATFRATNSNFPAPFMGVKARGSYDSPTAVVNNDITLQLSGVAYDGFNYNNTVAEINLSIDGTVASNATPGKIQFLTSASGSNNPILAMTIDSSQRVGIGTASPLVDFHIETSINSPFLLRKTGSTGIAMSAFFPTLSLNMYHDGTTWRSIGAGYTALWNQRPNDTGVMNFSISSTKATAAGQNMGNYNTFDHLSITPAGNVGIGDISPSFKLDVNGTGRFIGNLTAGSEALGFPRMFDFGNDSLVVTALGGSTTFMKAGESTTMRANHGFTMIRAGSITGIGLTYDITDVGDSSSVAIIVSVNGTIVWSNNLTLSVASDLQSNFTQARNADTFSAGDSVEIRITETGGSGLNTVSFNDMIGSLEVVYN